MSIVRSQEIQLHAASENLLLNDIGLVLKIFNEIRHEFIGIIDNFYILTNDPNDRSLCFRIIQVIEILADICEKPFVLVGILSENVSYHDDSFLNYIRNFSFESLPQTLDTFVSHLLQFYSTFAHGIYGLSNKLHIHLVNILLEFVENHQDILIVGNFGHHFELLELHIERIMIVDKEYLQLFREEKSPFLKDQINSFQH